MAIDVSFTLLVVFAASKNPVRHDFVFRQCIGALNYDDRTQLCCCIRPICSKQQPFELLTFGIMSRSAI